MFSGLGGSLTVLEIAMGFGSETSSFVQRGRILYVAENCQPAPVSRGPCRYFFKVLFSSENIEWTTVLCAVIQPNLIIITQEQHQCPECRRAKLQNLTAIQFLSITHPPLHPVHAHPLAYTLGLTAAALVTPRPYYLNSNSLALSA